MHWDEFEYKALPSHIVFGQGTLTNLPEEVEKLGGRRVLVLTTPAQRAEGDRVIEQLGGVGVGVYPHATMHTPQDVTEDALATMQALSADLLVAIGGGSTIGLSKALAHRTRVPQIAVPTTYAGSEVTPILGETANGLKTTIRSVNLLPDTVIYDVDLTLGLPSHLSAVSGINAIAHAIEALYARDSNPVTSLMAEEGVRALVAALPRIVAEPRNVPARTEALYGAWLCGSCLGTVGMALHHKLCHTLGGSLGLPHAETHAVILPYVIAFNAPATPGAMAALSRALGANDPARSVFDLVGRLGAAQSLAALGMDEKDIDRMAAIADEASYWNPRPVTRSDLRNLLRAAFDGETPVPMPMPMPMIESDYHA